MRRYAVLISFLGCLSWESAISGERIWIERGGVAVIEAESVDADIDLSKWAFASEFPGFSGSGYLIWRGRGNMYKDPLVYDAPAAAGEVLRYPVWINQPGNYAIHLRNIHSQEDGDNDVWVRVNRSDYYKIWDHDTGRFTWTEFNWKQWRLGKGLNEIVLRGRSRGFGIDRLVLHLVELPKSSWQDPARPESGVLIPDETSPLPPAPEAVSVRSGIRSALLTWKAPTARDQVLDYEITNGKRLLGTAAMERILLDDLESGTRYTLNVKTRDIHGRLSEKPCTVTLTTSIFNPAKGAQILRTPQPPAIDGVFDPLWHRTPFHPIKQPVQGEPDSGADLEAGFRAVWDLEGLYLLIEVIDDVPHPVPVSGSSSGEADGVRLFLDPDMSQSEHYSYSDRRFRILGSRGTVKESTQRDLFVEGVEAAVGDSVPPKRSWKKAPKGYLIEMALPWSRLAVDAREGSLLGLDILVQDDDNGHGADIIMAWHGESESAGKSPGDLGTAMLVNTSASGDPEGPLPKQVWLQRDRVFIIEAEAIDHHPNWVLKTGPSGYTGEGYLEWRGPDRSETFDGRGGNDDYSNERQGPQNEWLILRLRAARPGIYLVNARNHHIKEDGDNDAWVFKVGAGISMENPVRRMGDSLKDGPGFSWLDWGVRRFWLKAGENLLYIGGRSIGFGLDRIAVYPEGDEEARARALDLKTPLSRPEIE